MARALRDTPWPVLLLIASFLCPTELSVYVGSARLPPHRALLLVLLPFALFAIAGRRRIRPKLFDAAFVGFACWTFTTYIYHHGQADGLQTGGALALDSLGSYLVARAFVRDVGAFAATATTLLLGVMISGLLALPEMLTAQIYVHDILRQITGYVHPVGIEKRLGLTRAFGTFDHPIHLGTFCASSLALAVYAARKEAGAALRGLAIAICALTSLSSAPMLSLGLQAGLIGFERATRGIKGRVAMAVAAIVAAFGAVSLVATRSPFAIIATGFTLDSWTGFYRLMIWENGLANVWTNPLLGLGLNDWERPLWMVSSTIDAFWLVITMRTGIPAFLLLAMGIVLVVRGVNAGLGRSDRRSRRMATGWIISMLALILVGCTVHYWNVPFAYFFFFTGLGTWMADPLRAGMAKSVPVAAASPAPRIVWVTPETIPAGAAPPSPPFPSAVPAKWPVPVPRREAARATRTRSARVA
ncbi:MAG: O-antigen ligase family protein [Hyphomicrobiaceae bacterium]